MKKALIAFIALSTIILSGCNETRWETVNEEKLGLSFEKPMPWEDGKVDATAGYVDYVAEILAGKMIGNLSINLINPSTEELFTLEKEAEIAKNIFKGTKVKDLKFISEKDVMMLGEKAREIVMTFLNPNDETITEKVIATVTVKNNKSYRAILEEEEAEFDSNLPYYEKVRNSLRPLGDAAPAVK